MTAFEVKEVTPKDLELFDSLKNTNEWLKKNLEKIIEEHKGNFVAVREKKVLFSEKTLLKLEKELKKEKEFSKKGLVIFEASWEAFRTIF